MWNYNQSWSTDQSSARYLVSPIIERRGELPESLGKEAVEVSLAVGTEHFQSLVCLKSSQLEGEKWKDGRTELDVEEDGGKRWRGDIQMKMCTAASSYSLINWDQKYKTYFKVLMCRIIQHLFLWPFSGPRYFFKFGKNIHLVWRKNRFWCSKVKWTHKALWKRYLRNALRESFHIWHKHWTQALTGLVLVAKVQSHWGRTQQEQKTGGQDEHLVVDQLVEVDWSSVSEMCPWKHYHSHLVERLLLTFSSNSSQHSPKALFQFRLEEMQVG